MTKPKRKYRAHGTQVIAEPIHEKVKGGTRIQIGFPVLQVNDNIEKPERLARALAKMMTESDVLR